MHACCRRAPPTVDKDFDLLTASGPTQWLVSCYFALTTIVTIGYGDIVPVTVKEIGVVLVFQLVGGERAFWVPRESPTALLPPSHCTRQPSVHRL